MSDAKTVLLIDDDQDFLFMNQTQLEAAGYSVATADSAAEGLKKASEIKPDLVIADLMMEERDAGFTLCYNLKKQFPDMPVVMCSNVVGETGMGFDASTEEEQAWIKADVLLHKPIRFEQLQQEINRLLQ